MEVFPYTVFSLAIQHGFWTENCKCTPTTMMKFCNFLKSKQGSEILANFQKKVELCLNDNSFEHVHMLSRLSRQRTEFADERKRQTAEIEADIADHRRQIVLLEKKLDMEIVEVESCYLPASQYVPLDEPELLKRCYNMYVAKTIRSEEKVKELDQELIQFIKSEYEEVVSMEHMSDFMEDENRKRALKVWTDDRNKMSRPKNIIVTGARTNSL
jgi:hypothetical protein